MKLEGCHYYSAMQFDVFDLVPYRHYLAFLENGIAKLLTNEKDNLLTWGDVLAASNCKLGNWFIEGELLTIAFSDTLTFRGRLAEGCISLNVYNDIGYYDNPSVFWRAQR